MTAILTKIAKLPVLDLQVMAQMYGDDSAETVCFALSGFNREAQRYVCQLQQALTQTDWAEAARVAHRIKSMAGLCGALQLATLCQLIEQAARQDDVQLLTHCARQLSPCWQALWQQSLAELAQRSADED